MGHVNTSHHLSDVMKLSSLYFTTNKQLSIFSSPPPHSTKSKFRWEGSSSHYPCIWTWATFWSKMTSNYWVMVEKYPNLKEEAGSSIPDCEISSLPDKNVTCGQLHPMIWRWHVINLSKNNKNKNLGYVGPQSSM